MRRRRRRACSLIETNLDDLSPELVPDAAERCFAAGALDVWVAPVQMKKGRPGSSSRRSPGPPTSAPSPRRCCATRRRSACASRRVHRYELDREIRHRRRRRAARRGEARLPHGEIVNVAPEHDDCVAAARALGRPVKAVWARALAAAHARTAEHRLDG